MSDLKRSPRGQARGALRAGLAALLALGVSPGAALAWGNDGHRTIGLIAEHYLTAAQRAEVKRLLALPIDPALPANMMDRATWGDAYRDSDRNTTKVRYYATRKWHFVDIDIDNPDLKAACFGDQTLPAGTLASKGPADDCVARKIEQFQAELADRSLPDAERALALNFLLHFVGDLHQPLHAAEHDHDQGGNKVLVVSGSAQYGDTLHGYWDSKTVSRMGSSPQAISTALIAAMDQTLTPADLADWRRGGPRDWAQESFQIAKTSAYDIPAITRPCLIKDYDKPPKHEVCRVLPTTYAVDATGQARRQLEKAGVRLAYVIGQALQ